MTVLILVASIAEAATATWNANPESNIGGYVLSYGTQPGQHTTSIDVGNVTTYQFFPTPGRYYVVVQAYDRGRNLGPKSDEVVLDVAGNLAPTLQQPSNQAHLVNAAASLTLSGSDPEGMPITYSATGLPPGLSVNATSGVISGTLTSAGTYTVTARASDGVLTTTRTFTWTVTAPNQAPTLQQPSNQTTLLNASVTLALAGADPEGATLSYSATGLPPGLSLNGASGVISGTAGTAGVYNVTATASDGSLTASRTFTWTVGNTTTVTVSLTPVDSTLNLDDNNYSADPVLYAYTWPANMIANAIVMKFDLSSIPANATINSAALRLSLIDVDTATSDPIYTMTLHQIINRNPDLTRATGRRYDGVNAWTASACCYTSIPLAQSDISPARASLGVDRTLGQKTWDALTIVRSWQSSPSLNYGLLLNSDASKPADRSRSFASMENTNVAQRPVLVINYTAAGGPPPNQAPTLAQPANQSTVQTRPAAFTLSGSDPDGTAVTYSATGLPAGLAINASTGVISGTPTTPAVYTVTATVSDGSLTASRTFTWTITANQAPILAQLANQSTVQNTAAASLTLVGSDPEGATVSYSATGLPVGISVNSASGVVSGTPTTVGSYTVTASASDGWLSASRTFTWTVTAPNQAPTLAQPANQSTAQTRPATLTLSGSDPENATLAYSATGLPAGLAINASTGVISGTPTTAAVYTVTATVSDGSLTASRTFTWTITANQAPTLVQPANQSTVQNTTAASLTLVGSDPEGATVSYSATGLPAGISVNSASGVVSGTPTTVGSYTVTASVSDGWLSASRTFTWTVTAPNQAPTLAQPANQSSVQTRPATLTLSGSDPENATLTYSATGLPAGLAINASTGVISGTPTTAADYAVTATVSDGSLSASRTFTWAITANQAPTLAQPANQSTVQNTAAASLTLAGSDPEGAAISYAATGLPAGITVDSVSGVVSGTPTTVGSYAVTASVSDGWLSAGRTFTWTVTAPNQAPTLAQPANQSTVQTRPATLTLSGSDPENATLTYSATGLPAGLAINASTGVISGTPTTVATYNVAVTVSDGSLTASRTFTWTVTTPNQAPTLAQPANQSTMQNAAASLTLSGSDPEGAVVTYAAMGLPSGITLNSASGVVSGTPTTVGSYTVTVSVSDGSMSASRTFTWTVTAPSSTTVTVNLSPSDSTLNINDRNYASDPILYTYTWPTRKIANAVVMKFDLSQIPADATIDSATLQLSLIETDGATSDPTYTVTLHQLINKNPNLARATGRTFDGVSPWTSNNCCQQNIPLAQSDITPARASLAVNRTLGAKTWNAVDIVRSWMAAPASNYGLLLNSDATKPADRYRFFASMEHPTVSARPFLRVTYTTTAPAAQQTSSAGAPAGDAIDQFLAQNAEPGDQLLRGDFDGDGIMDPATFRDATGEWRLWLSRSNFAASSPIVWGAASDLQVAADYDGDRKTDIAVYRPSTGMWHVLLSSTNNLQTLDIQWGGAQDRPVAFDVDGDGRADLALPSKDGGYNVLLSGSGYLTSVMVR